MGTSGPWKQHVRCKTIPVASHPGLHAASSGTGTVARDNLLPWRPVHMATISHIHNWSTQQWSILLVRAVGRSMCVWSAPGGLAWRGWGVWPYSTDKDCPIVSFVHCQDTVEIIIIFIIVIIMQESKPPTKWIIHWGWLHNLYSDKLKTALNSSF